MKKVLLTILLITLSATVSATEVARLKFSEFKVKANVVSSGPVVIEWKANTDGKLVSLYVNAFGKIQDIPESILRQLGLIHDGVELTCEARHNELGGKTVYIEFHRGSISDIKQKAVLAVSEYGKPILAVSDYEKPEEINKKLFLEYKRLFYNEESHK